MGLYRSPTGAIEAIDDDKASSALASGYVPVTSAQAGAPVESDATGGALGALGAGATSVLSGATLGLSDVALRGILNRGDLRRLAADREDHPIISGAGQVAGAILPSLAAPESLLGNAPAGLLTRATAPLVEHGGISALAAGGIEGAVQNAGAYLSDVALGNRDLSAEGVAGALGGGFAFGAGAGAVAMGVERGTMAARRMFARVADGGERAANEAEQAWLTQYQSIVEAHDAAVDAAKAQLAAARAAREDAALASDRAAATTAETRINAPQIDAEHAAAREFDTQMSAELAAKQAAIKASEMPAVKVGNIDDLERLIFGQQEAKAELDDLIRKVESTGDEAASEIPDYATIKTHEAKTDAALEQTVSARSIADRGYYEPPGAGEDAVRVAKARKAIEEGQREPIDLNVSPEGTITVTGGRHRLAAAIEADAPIRVKWSAGMEPAASDVARGAASGGSDLEALLRGTSERVAAGESLKAIGSPTVAEYVSSKAAKTEATAQAFRERAAFRKRADIGSSRRSYKVKQLEIAHDAALDRAATAIDPAERAAATSEAASIERELSSTGVSPSAPDDIAQLAPAFEKFERKSTELTEALGDAAPPAAREHAAAFRAAEDEADRKLTDRTTRAVDDSVQLPTGKGTIMNPQDFERVFGKPMPLPPTSKEALAAAKDTQARASATYKRAKASETEAKIGARRAKDARAAIPEPPKPTPPVPSAPSTLGSIATAIGVAGELGIPGIPRPEDIPVIGPLLGAYIKYRAIKATAGRFIGRVAATGNTRAATLAAKTKDKIATAIDQTLGLAEKAAPKARAGMVAAGAVIGKRIFDDGQPDAPKDATRQEQAAVRIREILAANQRPELVSAMVRHEMRGVMDPDLIAAAEKHLIARFAHLASVVPKPPPDNDYAQRPWMPSPAAMHELEQRLAVIHDPAHALSGPSSPAAMDTFRQGFPELYQMAKDRLIARVGDLSEPMPRPDRLRASAMFQIPIDISLDPSHIAITRAPSKPDTLPQMANVPDLSQMYNPQNTRTK